jgi:hypothetical protein
MVLDTFVRALSFYGGVPRHAKLPNPKTMVTYVSRSKDRIFHTRFLALMNHYVMEPVACTPAAGWEIRPTGSPRAKAARKSKRPASKAPRRTRCLRAARLGALRHKRWVKFKR